ncbi:MAG: ABC transporter permease, partial [Acidobacteria bacterium]|nr:ABC transporter permease [Acidobacteriota bacterium]
MIVRPYETHIAFRFLLKGRGQSVLLLVGIAVGVAVQFFLSALIGGLQESLIERTVGSAPHIFLLPPDNLPTSLLAGDGRTVDSRRVPYSELTEVLSWRQYYDFLKTTPGVEAACPVAGGQGFIERGGATETVAIKGILPEEGARVYRLDRNLRSGRAGLGGDAAIVGLSVADKLRLDLGDRFFVRNSKGTGETFTVEGIVDLGAVQANALVFLSLDRARSFLGLDGISAVEVRVADPFRAEAVAAGLRREFSRVKFESWQSRNKELLTALRSQSGSSGLIQFFVLFAVSLGIASVLGIAAVQKSRQIGILKAMGVDDRASSSSRAWSSAPPARCSASGWATASAWVSCGSSGPAPSGSRSTPSTWSCRPSWPWSAPPSPRSSRPAKPRACPRSRSSAMADIIEARGLVKRFGDVVPTEVLHGIDVSFERGALTAVIGPSGSGKTTLLNIVSLLESPTAGTLAVDGRDFSAGDINAYAAYRNAHIGFIFQFHYLLPEFTALENILIPHWIGRGRPPAA